MPSRESGASSGMRWGVPPVDRRRTVLPRIRESLDSWIDGHAIVVVDAPSGFGKSTQVAAWVGTLHHDDAIVWISGGLLVGGWDDAWRVVADALFDLGLIDRPTHEQLDDTSRLFVALHRLSRRVILVIDEADRLAPTANLDVLEREVSRFPMLRVVVVISSPLKSDERAAHARRVVISRRDLAWTAVDTRAVLGETAVGSMVRMPIDKLVTATGGRASAILDYFDRAPENLAELSPDALRVRWIIQRTEPLSSAASATRLLLLLSQFIEFPRDYLPVLDVENVREVLLELVREGLVEALVRQGQSEPDVYRVLPEDRGALDRLALLRISDELPALHSAAADLFLAAGESVAALFHLARSGRIGEAVAHFASAAAQHGVAMRIEDVRRAVEPIPPAAFIDDEYSLALRVVLAHRPPVESRSVRAPFESALLSLPRQAILGLPMSSKALITAAAVITLTGRGRSADAVAAGRPLATELLRLPWHESVRAGRAVGLLWVAQAEAEILEGRITSGSEFAKAALDSIHDDDIWSRYMAESMVSLAAAIDGDEEFASAALAAAEGSFARGAWPGSARRYPNAFARLFVAAAQVDSSAMEAAALQLREVAEPGDAWWACGLVAESYAFLFAGEKAQAMATARKAMRVVTAQNTPAIVRSLVVAANADMLNSLGRPGAALAMLDEGIQTHEHAICYGARRATASLALGDPKRAVAATDGCIALGAQHATRSLVHVLFRRAVAQEMLGMHNAADSTFADAISHTSGPSSSGYFGAHLGIVRTLWSRLTVRDPALHAATADRVEEWLRAASYRSSGASGLTAALSTREAEVLALLRSGATNAQLSSALFLSANTVKSHLRNLYRKLGVTTRQEAIERADELGLALN